MLVTKEARHPAILDRPTDGCQHDYGHLSRRFRDIISVRYRPQPADKPSIRFFMDLKDRNQPIPWRRFLTEGTVIVLSILLAFWIDAWWQESEERKRELVVLQALVSDLQNMRNQFDQQRNYNEAILAATTQLLETGTAGDRVLDREQIDKLLGDIVWYNASGVWQSATMELLVSAGDLAALSDMNLVQLLVPLQNRLETAQARYRLDEAMYREELIPFLGAHASLPQILAGIEHAPGIPAWTYDFPDIKIAVLRDHSDLLSNTEFQGLLAAKIDLQHDILNYTLGDLNEDLDEVILVLRASLDQ